MEQPQIYPLTCPPSTSTEGLPPCKRLGKGVRIDQKLHPLAKEIFCRTPKVGKTLRPIKNSRGSHFAYLGRAAEGPVSTPFAKGRFFATLWLQVARSIARATGGSKVRTIAGAAGRRAMPHRRGRAKAGWHDQNAIRKCCRTM